MNRTVTEIVVGLAFVLGVGLLGTYTILSSGVSFGEKKYYVADFTEIWGLKKGDGVRVEGHEVGEVTDIRPVEGGRVRVTMQVPAEVEIYKNGGSDVSVVPFSPLGGRVVEIKRGRDVQQGTFTSFSAEQVKKPDTLPPEDVIEGKAVGELLQAVNKLIEDNRENVNQIVGNLKKVSDQLTKDDNALGFLINSEQGGKDIAQVTEGMASSAQRLDRILARVEQGDGVVGGLLEEGSPLEQDVNASITAARGALEGLDRIVTRADEGKSAIGVLVSDDPEVKDATRGIVTDVKTVTGTVAEGKGTLGKIVHDDRLYEGAANTAENLDSITTKVDQGKGLLGVLLEEESGENARKTLNHLASITGAIDDPEGGTLGLLVHDQSLRDRLVRVSEELESLIVEFRDSLEDVREQAPVNAFIGAVFSAF